MRKKERKGKGWMDGWIGGVDIEKQQKKERWEKIKKKEREREKRWLEQTHARTMIV